MELNHTHKIIFIHTLFSKSMRVDEWIQRMAAHSTWLHTIETHLSWCACVRERMHCVCYSWRSRPPNRGSPLTQTRARPSYTRSHPAKFIYRCAQIPSRASDVSLNFHLSKIRTKFCASCLIKMRRQRPTINEINCWPAIQIIQNSLNISNIEKYFSI